MNKFAKIMDLPIFKQLCEKDLIHHRFHIIKKIAVTSVDIFDESDINALCFFHNLIYKYKNR